MTTLGPRTLKALEEGPKTNGESILDSTIVATYCETQQQFARRVALIAVEEGRERLEVVGWIQQIGTKLAFFDGDVDPRTIHDNGKPCYPVYRIREGR